jgi:hypothetical protein
MNILSLRKKISLAGSVALIPERLSFAENKERLR